jgi:hypothetical protein
MKIQILEEIYNDASQPGSLSGLENFYRVLKSQKIKIKSPELKNWLSTQNVYTRHKLKVKQFPPNQVKTWAIDDLWQIDFADLQ